MAEPDDLPPPQRLALAYAPRGASRPWRDFLTLDARLAAIVRGAREPMLAQIRLAWWRERLGEVPGRWPTGEPLLARLAAWGPMAAGLAPLVDGWEALVGEPPLAEPAFEAFARARVEALAGLAARIGSGWDEAAAWTARRWALADLALHVRHPAESAAARDLLVRDAVQRSRLGAGMRPLAVLHTLARGELADHGPARRLGAAMRVGILGI